MIQVTQNFIDVVESESRQWRARLLYNGTDTGASIKALSVKGGSMSETTLNLCGCYSSSMEAIIDTGSFEFENKEIAVQFGLVLDDTTDPVAIEWVTTGYYTITEVERAKYQTTLTGAGRLSSKCGVPFSISTTQTVANIISAIQTTAGVTITVDSGIDTTIEIEKEIQNTTCFGALQIVCSVLGCFAYDKYDGTIHISKYPTTTTYTTTTSRMIQEPTFADNENEITGVRVITQEATTDADGNPVPAEDYHTTPETDINYTISNPYMTSTAFTEYSGNLVGLAWYKATLPIALGDPRFEPTDMVSITVDSTTYDVPCHNIVHTFDGGLQTTITALGDSESLAESQQTGAVAQKLKEINADILNVKRIVAETLEIAGHFFVGADGYVHITETENDYTTGNNVIVDSDSVDIRDGTTVLATFGTNTRVGQSTGLNVAIGSSSVFVRDGSTDLAYFGSTTRVGQSSGRNVFISGSSVDINNGSTSLASFGTNARIGEASSQNILISSTAVNIRNGSAVLASFGSTVTIGESGGAQITLNSNGASIRDENGNIGTEISSSGVWANTFFSTVTTQGQGTSEATLTASGLVLTQSGAGTETDIYPSQIKLQSGASPSIGTGAKIIFTDRASYEGCYIEEVYADAYGGTLLIRPGANLIMGGGEYASNRWNVGDISGNSENTYLGADNAVFIESNGNTIANRYMWTFGTDGSLQLPHASAGLGAIIKANGRIVKAADGTSLTTTCMCAGHVTNSTKSIDFFIPLPYDCTTVTPTSMTVGASGMSVRGVNGYLDGSQYLTFSDYTATLTGRFNGLQVRLTKTSGTIGNVTNNTPVSVQLISVQLNYGLG